MNTPRPLRAKVSAEELQTKYPHIFINLFDGDAELVWISPQKELISYGSIKFAERRTIPCFPNRIWLIRKGEQCQIFLTENHASLAIAVE